jgi:hypothetical protein
MKLKNLVFAFVVALVFAACSKDSNESGKALLNVRLTDVPADFVAVNIDLQGVQINLANDSNGWIALAGVPVGVYNLLDFAAGADTLIASDFLKPGYYNQIRLILGSNNSIDVKEGDAVVNYLLKVPSGSTSGLKLNLHKDLRAGVAYTILLDFDAARSVVKKGNGDFSLKPVIRMSMAAESGSIMGKVHPDSISGFVYIYKTLPTDTIASTFLNDMGEYMLKGIAPETYVLRVVPSTESGFPPKEVTDVVVVKGEVTEVPVVMFP